VQGGKTENYANKPIEREIQGHLEKKGPGVAQGGGQLPVDWGMAHPKRLFVRHRQTPALEKSAPRLKQQVVEGAVLPLKKRTREIWLEAFLPQED